MSLLPVPAAPAAIVSLGRAASYAAEARAGRTRAAYTSAFRVFAAWGVEGGVDTLPAEPATVAAYVAHLADTGRKAATINLHVAAIAAVHRAAGLDNPTAAEAVRATVRGIRRTIGTRQARKAPATAETVKKMVRKLPDGLTGLRDRALILLGFAAALRRSELVALDVADLERAPDGIVLHIRRSKTDQDGAGQEIAVPRGSKLKPCEALDAWLAAARITAGPVFRPVNKGGAVSAERLTDRSVADIVKRHAAAAGLDATLFSGHSLRAGFVTSALAAGADVLKVMHVTRHTQVTTLQKYDRRARAFDDHAGRKFL